MQRSSEILRVAAAGQKAERVLGVLAPATLPALTAGTAAAPWRLETEGKIAHVATPGSAATTVSVDSVALSHPTVVRAVTS